MKNDIISMFVLLIFGLLYLFFFAKLQNRYFKNLSQPNKNSAVLIVFVSSLISASINLVHITDLAADALRFFLKLNNVTTSIMFAFAFFAGMWVFSILLFRFSYIIIGFLTPEKEDDELMKNNIELALIHSVILISITFVIAPALVKLAAGFIPYPTIPF
jgi:hypothetical protein